MGNQNNLIRTSLYTLTREYGEMILIKRHKSASTDYTNGTKVIEELVITVRYAVRLPEQNSAFKIADFIIRKYSLPTVPDKRVRQFIVDSRQLPVGFVPQLEDVIIMGTAQYRTAKVEKLEADLGFLLTGEEING